MPKVFIDLTEQKFGKISPIKILDKVDNFGRKIWLCKCDCGNEFETAQHSLKSGNTKSCGCSHIKGVKQNLINKKFNRLLVISALSPIILKNGKRLFKYICLCDCGTYKEVDHHSLINNKIKSCGCLHTSNLKQRIGENHPNWKKEKTKRPARRDYKANKWSNFILKRDNYTCQKCQNKDCVLNAHHLDSWTLNKDERYNPLNGVTLCLSCHQELHRKFGKTPTVNNSLKFLGYPEDNDYFYTIEKEDFELKS